MAKIHTIALALTVATSLAACANNTGPRAPMIPAQINGTRK
jgi:hypothetical protein